MFRSYPGLFLLGMIIPGIVLADLFPLQEWIYLLLSLIFCLLGFITLNHQKQLPPILLFGLSILLFSAFNFGLRFYPTGHNHVTKFADNHENYHIYGEVADWPKVKLNSTEIKVRLDSLSSDYFYHVQGMVMLKISDTTTSLERGDRVEFYGQIYSIKGGKSPRGFNYHRYLNLKGIHGIVYLSTLLDVRVDKRNRYGLITVADKMRAVILSSLRKNLNPATSALAAGFLIGETRDIPGDIYSWFRDSGTMHLLAVSGSNVILVIIFFTFLLKPFRVSGNKRSLILLIILLMFTLISYGEPSVIRASLMASLILLVGMIGRSYNLNNIISITAAIILLVNPSQLFDVGFQLSFVTAWGLIFVVPVIHGKFENFHNRLWYRYLILPALVSFVAQICSGPLIVLYFQRLPIISVAANLVIVLLTSIAVIGIMALLIADLILPTFGLLVGSIVNKIIELIIICLKFFGGQEIPVITTGIVPIFYVFLFYSFLIFGVWSLSSKPVRRLWIVSFIIALNFLFFIPVVNSFKEKNKTDIWISSIPGGVAGFVKKQGNRNGDLIISGLNDRDYPVDDIILKPILENLGIEKLNSVIIISSDFGSLKDLINLISDFDAETVFISDRLANSIKDIIIQSGFHKFEQRIKILSDQPVNVKFDGLFPFNEGIIINIEDNRIIMLHSLDSKSVDLISQTGISTLVISKPSYHFMAISELLNQTKLAKLIVLKINNDPGKILQNQFISGQTHGFELINLDLDGFYHTSFPE